MNGISELGSYKFNDPPTLNTLSASELELFVARKMEISSLTVEQFIREHRIELPRL